MATGERPLVTFVVLAFNQQAYVREAIDAALAQTYSPLEIILSDDCSTDGTFEVMQQAAAAYQGPHRVVLNRNPRNLHIGAHVSRLGELATGELLVLSAGDDASMPQRTEQIVSRWLELGRPTAALYSDFQPMDAASQNVVLPKEGAYRGRHSKHDMARGHIRVIGATSAYTRDVFTAFPPIDPAVKHEDRVLPFRVALLGGVVSLIEAKLIRYRIFGGISRIATRTAEEFLFNYLPAVTTRTLPDARQRLADLEAFAPNDIRLRRACMATIAEFEARLELLGARGVGLELAALKWLWKGASAGSLAKLYLKNRGYPLYKRYFQRKLRAAE